MYRLNKYVSIYDQPEDDVPSLLIFNAMTGGLYKVVGKKRIEVLNFKKNFCGLLSQETKEFLLKEQVLLVPETDELLLVKNQFNIERMSKKELYVTYAMTQQCNLRCLYCYQNHADKHIDIQSIDKSIKYVMRNIEGYAALKVHWFGGEPLMTLDMLRYASIKYINMSKEIGFIYSSGVTTNGTLFNPIIAKELKELKVKQVQFTLDGVKVIHDKLRAHKTGKGTFNKIIDSMKIAAEYNFTIYLRINISKLNVSSFPVLLDLLIENGLGPEKIFLYLNELKEHGFSSLYPNLYFDSVVDYSNTIAQLLKEMKIRGFPLPMLRPIGINCEFDKPSTMLFGTDGNLYHCTTATDKPMGKLTENGELEEKTELLNRIHNRKPWDDYDCKSCNHLPLCMGGCAYLEEEVKTKCNPSKFILEPLVKLIAN